MKNRKIIHIVSGLCFWICGAVFAEFSVSAQIDKTAETSVLNGIAAFSGMTDAADGKVTYLVKPKGADDGDFLAIGEMDIAADGGFKIEFGLTESGTYVLDIRDFSGDVYSETIEYTTAEDRQKQLLESINTGTESDAEKALSELDFSYNEISFTALADGAKTQIAKYVKLCGPYTSVTDVENEYKKQNAFYMINTAKAAGIKAEVSKHRDFLGLTENYAVNKFISSAGTAQQSALVNSLFANPAYTTDMLISAITSANNAADTPSDRPSPGGGGGGGGSSSSGSSSANRFVSTVVKPAEEPKEEAKEEIKGFADMDASHWASTAVSALAERGVISGDENGNFRPNSGITREEYVKMVVVAFGVKAAENNFAFLDVFDNDWYFEYVGAAYEAGIVNGISPGCFGINKSITRQDAAVILKRAADYAGTELKAVRDYNGFNDEDEISDYAADAVNTLYRSGIINGMDDGGFKPTDFCTRAETAKMIYEIIIGR